MTRLNARLVNTYIPLLYPVPLEPPISDSDYDAVTATIQSTQQPTSTTTTAASSRRRRSDGLQKQQHPPPPRIRSRPNRSTHELRPLSMETSLSHGNHDNDSSSCVMESNEVTGWSRVKLGDTEVLCHVYAPVPFGHDLVPASTVDQQQHPLDLETGILYCDVRFASHFAVSSSSSSTYVNVTTTSLLSTNKNSSTNETESVIGEEEDDDEAAGAADTTETIATPIPIHLRRLHRSEEGALSRKLYQALFPAVSLGLLHNSTTTHYAKSAIVVHVTILAEDGGLLSTVLVAATLALIDAGVEMTDIPSCGQVAVVSNNNNNNTMIIHPNNANPNSVVSSLWADPTAREEGEADALLTVAVLGGQKEVTYWNQQGTMSPDVVNQATELCLDACRTWRKFVRTHLYEGMTTRTVHGQTQ